MLFAMRTLSSSKDKEFMDELLQRGVWRGP